MTKDCWSALSILSCCLALGCGTNSKTPAEIKGVIRYNGQLVKGGTIRFQSKDAGTYGSVIHDDGSYSVMQVAPGDMVVTIETESANPDIVNPLPAGIDGGQGAMSMEAIMEKRRSAGAKSAEGTGSVKRKENYLKIPEKYADPNQSGLMATLGRGSLTKDFDLTD
jgi:hypothetical protein